MATTFSIGSVSFLAIDGAAAGRYALALRVDAEVDDNRRFHVPGVNGNYIIRAGRVNQKVMASVRYQGPKTSVYDHMKADGDAWAVTAVTVTDPDGNAYTGCNLESFSRSSDPRGTGRTAGHMFFDAIAIFKRDL